MMLYQIWKHYGGATKVAAICGVHKQAPVNWYIRGRVPIQYIGILEEKLKLSFVQKFALNYNDRRSVITQVKTPTWKEVVNSFPFSKQLKEKILFYAPPKTDIPHPPGRLTKRKLHKETKTA